MQSSQDSSFDACRARSGPFVLLPDSVEIAQHISAISKTLAAFRLCLNAAIDQASDVGGSHMDIHSIELAPAAATSAVLDDRIDIWVNEGGAGDGAIR